MDDAAWHYATFSKNRERLLDEALMTTPHVARNTARKGGSAIDARTTRHAGYEISQRKRKLIETTFGWPKQYDGLRRMMYRRLEKVRGQVKLMTCAFHLLRISHLVPVEAL